MNIWQIKIFSIKVFHFTKRERVQRKGIAKDLKNVKYSFVAFINIKCFSKYIKWLGNNGAKASHNSNKLYYVRWHTKLEGIWGEKNKGLFKKSI